MKILITLLMIFPLALQAQHKEEITQTFDKYFAYMADGEYAQSLNYLPEQFFDIVPRAQMEQAIDQTFNNPSFSITMKDGKVTAVSDEIVHEDMHYATLDYTSQMTVQMSESADPQMFSALKQSFEQQSGSANVTADADKGQLIIDQKSTMYAIKGSGGTWKFVEKSPQVAQIIQQFIPSEVLSQL